MGEQLISELSINTFCMMYDVYLFFNILLQLKTREEVDHNLDCSNENSLMEFLIPVAVSVQVKDTYVKLLDVTEYDGISFCKWYYCNFSEDCGNSNISQQHYNFMYSKLNKNKFCTLELESFSCDQCQ